MSRIYRIFNDVTAEYTQVQTLTDAKELIMESLKRSVKQAYPIQVGYLVDDYIVDSVNESI
jgi:hypothetical protein